MLVNLILPVLIIFTVIVAKVKNKNAFSLFVEGSKEGFSLFKEVFPTMLGMLLSVSMIRASGFLEDLFSLVIRFIDVDKNILEVFPLAVLKPLSGSASMGMLSDVCVSCGPSSLSCKMGSAIVSTTDTTLYVLALYFESIGITKWRHSLKVGLFANVVGVLCATILSILLFGF